MTLFTIVYVRRSDGKVETVNRGRVRERNEPTKEQLDAKPNSKGVSDYYRVLSQQDSKHIDWRRKLAGMLVKELTGKEFSYDKAYILDDLPENYRLYEHVKSKPTDAENKPGKTHAGGGHDRQDAYLYGHPGGRKKRYRSPGDFFPHLLWLCTDETGDPQNCSCKVCSPDEIQTDVKPVVPARGGTVSMKVETQEPKNVVGRSPAVEVPARATPQIAQNSTFTRPAAASPPAATAASPVQQPHVPQQPQISQVPQQPQVSQISQIPQQPQVSQVSQIPQQPQVSQVKQQPQVSQVSQQPQVSQPPQASQRAQILQQPQQRPPEQATLPTPKTLDQQVDMVYGQLNFRLGELVWFNRGQTWALGVIVRRWLLRNVLPQNSRRYLIQPLSAPFLPQNSVIIDDENALRPWLAWSPPAFCHPGLNQGPRQTFASMDWNALISGRYGQSSNETVVVDASILAARAIDSTYTPFGYLNSTLAVKVEGDVKPHYTTHQILWSGVFLGGERIWIGDPVRLRASSGEDVLVIAQIIERPLQYGSGPQSSPTKIIFTGNLFSCSTLASDAVRPESQHLIPIRMREDLDARNRAIQAIGGPKSYWKLIQVGQGVDLANIKGRWYETSIVAPIVNSQASYDDCVRSGQTDSVARSFNGRVDLGNIAGTRVDTREGAFGRAVPENVRLVDSIEPPQPAEIPKTEQPQPPMQPQTQQIPVQSSFDTQMGGAEHGDHLVNEFMNLGDMETENIPGFGQEYSGPGAFFP